MNLAEQLGFVCDVHADVLHIGAVKSVIFKRQSERAGLR